MVIPNSSWAHPRAGLKLELISLKQLQVDGTIKHLTEQKPILSGGTQLKTDLNDIRGIGDQF